MFPGHTGEQREKGREREGLDQVQDPSEGVPTEGKRTIEPQGVPSEIQLALLGTDTFGKASGTGPFFPETSP